MIKLINADCLPAMKEMPDKAFELAIVDPPYGIFGGGRSVTTSTGLKKKSKKVTGERGRVNIIGKQVSGILHQRKNISWN
ncbi:MAG: hypothetical protein LLG05_15910 [Porphyromonadaceae bacterium]|nr:hypothetical protein [Porphyromonadaceae bacterium]